MPRKNDAQKILDETAQLHTNIVSAVFCLMMFRNLQQSVSNQTKSVITFFSTQVLLVSLPYLLARH